MSHHFSVKSAKSVRGICDIVDYTYGGVEACDIVKKYVIIPVSPALADRSEGRWCLRGWAPEQGRDRACGGSREPQEASQKPHRRPRKPQEVPRKTLGGPQGSLHAQGCPGRPWEAEQAQEVPRGHGRPKKLREAPGSPGKRQEAPRGPMGSARRPWEAPGGDRRPWGAPGRPGKPRIGTKTRIFNRPLSQCALKN